MQKTMCALAAAAGVALAGAASAQRLTTEGFRGLPAGDIASGVVGGAADLDAAGVYNNNNYGSTRITVVDNDTTDYPTNVLSGDNKYLQISGDDDVFLRVINSASIPSPAPITGTAPITSIAFALRIDSVDGTAANNDVDFVRLIDVATTGPGTTIFAISSVDGVITSQSNGTGAAGTIANVSALTVGRWYVLAARYDRGTGSFEARLIDSTTGATVGTNSQTGLTASNSNGVSTIATGATFDVPSGTASFQVSLDDVSFYNGSQVIADLVTTVRADYALPSSVSDWTAY